MTRALPGTRQHKEIMRMIHADAPAIPPKPIPPQPIHGPAGVLVLMSCGARKLITDRPVPLHELYLGPMWSTLRAHRGLISWKTTFVLSAGLGFMRAEDEARPYDALLTASKAHLWMDKGISWPNDRFGTLARFETKGPSPASLIATALPHNGMYSRVIVAGANHYRKCLEFLVREAQQWGIIAPDAPALTLAGGIGHQRQQLGEHLASAQL